MFNLVFKANQIVISDNLHASTSSETAKSRKLLSHQLQVITSLPSNILSTGRELYNFSFESAGLAGARRVETLKIIQSPMSATQQERRRAYRRKRNARRGPPAVEPQPFNQP